MVRLHAARLLGRGPWGLSARSRGCGRYGRIERRWAGAVPPAPTGRNSRGTAAKSLTQTAGFPADAAAAASTSVDSTSIMAPSASAMLLHVDTFTAFMDQLKLTPSAEVLCDWKSRKLASF